MFINRMFYHNICDEELSPVVLRKPRLWGIPIKDKLHHFNCQKQRPYSKFPSILPCIFSCFSSFLLFFSFLLLFSFPLFLPSMRPLCPFFSATINVSVYHNLETTIIGLLFQIVDYLPCDWLSFQNVVLLLFSFKVIGWTIPDCLCAANEENFLCHVTKRVIVISQKIPNCLW